ncbi:MAG: TIR domain-containing protein [Pseudomonadota bacterium]
MANDVFLSYARSDIQRAEVVKDLLEGLGLSVFFDTEGLDSGDIFPDILDREVKSAGAVVGVWSKHALTRPWVKIECDIGKTRGVLVPIQIEQISELDRPAAFWNIQFSDLSDFEGDTEHAGWLRFIRSLARTLDRPDLLARESAAQAAEPETDDANVRAELDALRAELSSLQQAKMASAALTPPPSVDPTATNLALWQEIKGTDNPAAMRRFLETVRGTPLEHVVEARLGTLENAKSEPTATAATEAGYSEPNASRSNLPWFAAGGLAALLIGVAVIVLSGQSGPEPDDGFTGNGSPSSQFAEGAAGSLGSSNDTDSVAYHEQSCEDGIASGCQQAAMAYAFGEGVAVSETKATELFQRGCDLRDAETCWAGGIQLEQYGNLDRAADLYDEACQLGASEGCELLDQLQDMQAAEAYEAAVERLQRALISKGFLNGVADGVSGPQTERAMEAFRVESGSTMRVSMNEQNTDNIEALARTIEDWIRPLPVFEPAPAPKPSWALGLNDAEANRRAEGCINNDALDCYFLGGYYRDATGIPEDQGKANQLFRLACDGSYWAGCNNLGYSYKHGRSIELNYDKANELFKLGCDNGNLPSCNNLAHSYEFALGLIEDKRRAVQLYTRGCDSGNMLSCNNLGTLYYDGGGNIEQDRVRAKGLHTKACDGGNETACQILIDFYD